MPVHHKLKTRVVKETPRHKQLAHRVWSKQEQRRRRSHTEPDVFTVEESPNKSLTPGVFGAGKGQLIGSQPTNFNIVSV